MPDTERELFESAMDDTPEAIPVEVVEPEKPQTEPEKPAEGELDRDAKGRFTPKAKAEAEPEKPAKVEPEKPQASEPVVAQPPVKEPERQDHRVPLAEHLSEREKRQAAERRAEENERALQNLQRQIAQQQQQTNTPKPNLFENPEQWEQQQTQGFQSLLQQQSLNFSEQLARIKYGDETYNAAEKAAEQVMLSGQMDPTLMSIRNAPNPGAALVEWHKRKQALERLGNLDPDKYVEQEIEKRLNDPQFLAKAVERARTQAQGQPGPATQKPVTTIPSLNRQTSAASSADGDQESDRDIFKSALTR